MNSTAHFAKNFIITDYCARRTKEKTYVLQDSYRSVDMYNIISPNIILYSIYDNFLELDLTDIKNSYVFRSLMSTFEIIKPSLNGTFDSGLIISNGTFNDVLFEAVNKVTLIILSSAKHVREKFKNNITYMSEVEYNMYNTYVSASNEDDYKHKNDIFLMEIALLISYNATTFDDNLKKLSEFVNKISDNSIKILSFISIGIFGYYAKIYSLSEDNLYKKEKWMNRLIDLFMDGGIKKYLNNIDNNEYKKFMFMIIKYSVISESINMTIPYARINKIAECFISSLDEEYDYIPGYTADQLFIITYDLFVSSHNWLLFLTSASMIYTELLHVNIIMSWYYFILNKEDISKYFNIKGPDDNMNMYIGNASDITQLMRLPQSA